MRLVTRTSESLRAAADCRAAHEGRTAAMQAAAKASPRVGAKTQPDLEFPECRLDRYRASANGRVDETGPFAGLADEVDVRRLERSALRAVSPSEGSRSGRRDLDRAGGEVPPRRRLLPPPPGAGLGILRGERRVAAPVPD